MEELFDDLAKKGILKNHTPAGQQGKCNIVIWCDCGPHFRCLQFFSSAIAKWCEMYRCSFEIRPGVESHMKGDIDRYFSVIDRRLNEARCDGWTAEENKVFIIFSDPFKIASLFFTILFSKFILF